MILDEYILIKWHATNKKHFIDKGYVFTNIGEHFFVKVVDLKLGSHYKINVKCDVCGNEKILEYKVYNNNIKNGIIMDVLINVQ